MYKNITRILTAIVFLYACKDIKLRADGFGPEIAYPGIFDSAQSIREICTKDPEGMGFKGFNPRCTIEDLLSNIQSLSSSEEIDDLHEFHLRMVLHDLRDSKDVSKLPALHKVKDYHYKNTYHYKNPGNIWFGGDTHDELYKETNALIKFLEAEKKKQDFDQAMQEKKDDFERRQRLGLTDDRFESLGTSPSAEPTDSDPTPSQTQPQPEPQPDQPEPRRSWWQRLWGR